MSVLILLQHRYEEVTTLLSHWRPQYCLLLQTNVICIEQWHIMNHLYCSVSSHHYKYITPVTSLSKWTEKNNA